MTNPKGSLVLTVSNFAAIPDWYHMHPPILSSSEKMDSALAAVLIASPAWASWLGGFNEILTSVTLFCGAVLGMGRLWLFLKRLRDGPGS